MPIRRRQTQSYLRNLFASRGIVLQKRLGQNFLIDLNLHELIVKTAEVGPADLVLEVGTGAGALTALLAERAAAVVAVEIDPAMAALAAEATSDQPSVRLIQADALARKSALNPAVLDAVRAALAAAPGRRFKLVANLPYVVATPVIMNLLVHAELCPSLMVVTVQLELAERMKAAPQTEAYGALSVMVEALAECDIVRVLPPAVFWPRPKVDSALVKLVPRADKRATIGDLPWFHQMVRRVFLHRRKNLRRVLYSLWGERLNKAQVDELLADLDLTGQVRAEALTAGELLALAHALKLKLGAEAAREASAATGDADADADRQAE